jgi:amino acid transporter
VLRKVSPKVAGACTIVLGVLVAIVAGAMIAYPPLSILGAIMLVSATILMSIGCVWLVRRSWDEPWPEQPDQAKLVRRRRRLLITNCVQLAGALAYGIFSAVNGSWWAMVFALVLAVYPSIIILIFFKLRANLFPKSDRQSTFPGFPQR